MLHFGSGAASRLRAIQPARPAALVAVIFICLAAGCRKRAPSAPPSHFVNITALLPLHPAWPQLAFLELDLKAVSPQVRAPRMQSGAFAGPFTPPKGVPPDRVADHEKLVKDDAARYIGQLTVSLEDRSRELEAAHRRALEQEAKAQYDLALVKKTAELRDAASAEARALERQVTELNYRQETLASQSRVYTASGLNARRMLDDIKLQQVELDKRVQALNTQISGILGADFKGLAKEAEKEFERKGAAGVQAGSVEFATERRKADAQEVADARARIDARPAPISPLVDAAVESPAGAASLAQPVEVPTAAVFAGVAGFASAGSRQRAKSIQAQIDSLMSMIIDDTRKSVDQIAHRERWTPSFVPSDDDWTERVAAEIRNQWKNMVPE